MTERNKEGISNVRQLLIGFFILVLLMVGAYYYFFHELRVTGEKISTLSNETTSLLTEETNLNSLKAVFSDTTNERQKINSYFVQSDGAVDFITIIENLATFANLNHETQTVNTEEENPSSANRERLHITFRTNGSWQNTYYFISLLESLPFQLTINQINLHSTGGTVAETISSSSSTSISTVATKKSSVWETSYDISVTKLK